MSNELEAFLEYISVTRALSKKSVEAYKSDLLHIEELTSASLIKLEQDSVLAVLSSYENKRTLNRKLSALNAFLIFVIKVSLKMKKQDTNLQKFQNFSLNFYHIKIY
ncbi:site-specific integrase [Sulfurimonas sp.]|uniref:site-specific integrase n=1 Tax=Sulfurimonas sp. TaxID=2022749 RepID=UPI002AB02C3B|nr:site-specific integrase [Sulfurimonas sp.]